MPPALSFQRNFSPQYGGVDNVSPLIRRVVAKNPSPFTYTGTGTYIIGHKNVAIIDPGPNLKDHIEALLRAIHGEKVAGIFVTHTHNDHSPAAAPLKKATGAPVYAFGGHGHVGKKAEGNLEEGVDHNFAPDILVRHGQTIQEDGWTLECVHTPGHTSNHMCYALKEEKALFSGDHVMGWATTVIVPPDGDMAKYMASLQLLLDRDDAVYWPTHGLPISSPKTYVQGLIEHRRARERAIVRCLEQGVSTIAEIVKTLYHDVDARLHGAAGYSVLAHIVQLMEQGRIRCVANTGIKGHYALV